MIIFSRLLLLFCCGGLLGTVTAQRVSLSLDCSEADAVLSILDKINRHASVTDSDWNVLTNTLPYQEVQAREASFHNSFSNDDFKKFVESGKLAPQAADLAKTLNEWRNEDMQAIGNSVISYLPPGATIRAKVFILIKPASNSFVWNRPGEDKAIFLYLNPSLSKAQFANKVAHESHHIGMESMDKEEDKLLSALPAQKQKAIRWLGGFGEGEAMLAAAGAYNIHPHSADDLSAREQWDKDMGNFNRDLDSLQQFYELILNGTLDTRDKIEVAASTFRGAQGPWYTVGYRMAALVEKYFGRKVLAGCYVDQRKLLSKYNQAAQKENAKGGDLRLWSAAFLKKLG